MPMSDIYTRQHNLYYNIKIINRHTSILLVLITYYNTILQ